MGKILRMTLATISTKKPIGILYIRKNPTDETVMECLGDLITNNTTLRGTPIDEYFRIERDVIEEEMIGE